MIYRVSHATRYRYSSNVELAAHMLHLRPLSLPYQRIDSERLVVTPTPSRLSDGVDHFGNRTTWVFFDHPHGEFEVTSEAVVEVSASPPPASTPAWEKVRAAAHWGGPGAWEAAEFRFSSPLAPIVDAAGAYAAPSFTPGRPILDALIDLNLRINRDFAFRSGVTTTKTTVQQVLERREGVCQDFTHLMVSSLRALGLPARYTSGYIRTKPPPGQARLRGADMSHAWCGGWLGPDHGWVGLDPTNAVLAQEEHVIVAFGRDFTDISPVRGMLLGGGTHALYVAVDLEPVDADAERAAAVER